MTSGVTPGQPGGAADGRKDAQGNLRAQCGAGTSRKCGSATTPGSSANVQNVDKLRVMPPSTGFTLIERDMLVRIDENMKEASRRLLEIERTIAGMAPIQRVEAVEKLAASTDKRLAWLLGALAALNAAFTLFLKIVWK